MSNILKLRKLGLMIYDIYEYCEKFEFVPA